MTEFNLNILHQDLFSHRIVEKGFSFSVRNTVRGVIFDENNAICIRSKKGSGFYFLPGGGVEENENPVEALKRECLEEAGCNIINIQKIGTVIEHRDEMKEKRTSECFKANLIGEKLEPTLAVGDEEGFDVIWIGLDKAVILFEKQMAMVTENTKNFYSKTFNIFRDLEILRHLK